MASTPVLSFRPAGVQACAAASGANRSKRKVGSGGGGSSWWTPLFGWPAEPDYIDGSAARAAEPAAEGKAVAAAADVGGPAARGGKGGRSVAFTDEKARRSVAFTDEKARRLRMMMAETSTFHDVMYHSSIASRLASDFSRRSGQ